MNISEIVSTPERERILRYLLYARQVDSQRKIAMETKVSPPQVHKYLAILKKDGLIKDLNLKDDSIIRALRFMENIIYLREKKIMDIIQKYISCMGIGLYGSWAKGTNDENADLDIWILIDEKEEVGLRKRSVDLVLGKLRRALEDALKRKVDLMVLMKQKLLELKNNNPNMYYSLYHSIILWGEGIV